MAEELGAESSTETRQAQGLDGFLAGDEVKLEGQEEPRAGEIGQLNVQLSASLHRKLISKAESEGVGLGELVAELLAEGVVLRAWEIMERKSALRNPSSQGQGSGSYNNSPNNRHNNNRSGFNGKQGPNQSSVRGRSQGPQGGQGNGAPRRASYQQIMDDRAHFVEYVRSQEKKQR